ncbi:hypothetical protein LUZ60_004553 [Juncus effusus]|nr:hypothetical protein LUZ60_004553 [Juncus effusus]
MPLYKRKPFALLDPPKDLKPNESVFQVRFTKEIFTDYLEYLKRVNLYRERVWTCKVTGKQNLTYEEALVSENKALQKVQNFPRELIGPVLNMIQFSTSNFSDLVDTIWVRIQENVYEGLQCQAKKDNIIAPCKIMKIIPNGESSSYEIGWLDKDKQVINTSIVNSDDLIRKKSPISKNMLRFFIKNSTSQNAPWIVNQELSKKYDISTNLPEELKGKFVFLHGFVRCAKNSKRALSENAENGENSQKNKRRKGAENGTNSNEEKETIKYPIEDLSVKSSPEFTKRPSLCTEFRVPMESVGDLLSVWDFCSSFAKLLRLFPFSLSEFENAICHREGNVNLIFEVHSAIFGLLMEDSEDYFKRRSKITQVNWREYLCDFLEREEFASLSNNIATIKRGHYGLIDTEIKLKILRELVEEALTTGSVREKLEEQVKRQTALRAEKREKDRLKKETQNGSDNAETGQSEKKEKSSEKKKPNEAQNNLEKEIEKLKIRTNSLGKDRNYNRYWFFQGEGRLFVESSDCKQWGFYSTKEELDVLIDSLNPKGIRERALQSQLKKRYQKISSALEKRRKDENQKILLEEAILRRSTRVRAQPRDNPANSFLKYSNKWKEA